MSAAPTLDELMDAYMACFDGLTAAFARYREARGEGDAPAALEALVEGVQHMEAAVPHVVRGITGDREHEQQVLVRCTDWLCRLARQIRDEVDVDEVIRRAEAVAHQAARRWLH